MRASQPTQPWLAVESWLSNLPASPTGDSGALLSPTVHGYTRCLRSALARDAPIRRCARFGYLRPTKNLLEKRTKWAGRTQRRRNQENKLRCVEFLKFLSCTSAGQAGDDGGAEQDSVPLVAVGDVLDVLRKVPRNGVSRLLPAPPWDTVRACATEAARKNELKASPVLPRNSLTL